MQPHLFVTHSARVQKLAQSHGWLPGARYTNLRDVRGTERVGFLDIDWRAYNFRSHLTAARDLRPMVTVARDVLRRKALSRVLEQAWMLAEHSQYVIVVPKDPAIQEEMESLVPQCFLFGYSVPTRYGGTSIPTRFFKRPVHLLGGRPDVQRRLGAELQVFSLDCNRFTLDARFGDYFDGQIFRPHPVGGYERCLLDSIRNITELWRGYHGRGGSNTNETRLG